MAVKERPAQTKDGKLIIEDKTYTPLQLRREYISLAKSHEVALQGAYCHCCGMHKSKDDFYACYNDTMKSGVCPVCKKCLHDILHRIDENGDLHDITEESLIHACHLINIPFIRDIWNAAKEQAESEGHKDYWKIYHSMLRVKKYRKMTFMDSDAFATKIVYADEIVNQRNLSPSEAHIQINKDRSDVIRLIGFDPFVNENPVDQEYLYPQLLGLLDSSEDSAEDMMKVQSAISIVRSFLQISKIDDAIAELMVNSKTLKSNGADIGRLQESKLRAQNGVTKLAAESCISLKNSKDAKKGDNTWTGKIKKIKDMNLRSAELNGFDLQTCKAMEQVLDISNKSILKQLRLDESEWSNMVAEQREMLTSLQKSNAAHKEISRILLRENLDLKEYLKSKDMLDEENVVNLRELYSRYGLALEGSDDDE